MSTGMAPRRGPVRHWRHAQASPAGHGGPFRPGGHRGELTRLSAFVRWLGRTAPARPMLFLCEPSGMARHVQGLHRGVLVSSLVLEF